MLVLFFIIALLVNQSTSIHNDDTRLNKRILVNDATMVASEITVLKQKVEEFENLAKDQDSTIQMLQTKINALETISENQKTELRNQKLLIQSLQSAQNNKGGTTYVRWGRNSCPSNGTELVYTGFTGGDGHRRGGGQSNTLCLPGDPTWGSQNLTNIPDIYAIVDGAEYQTSFFGTGLQDEDVPCAVCRTLTRSSVLMIPARTKCYDGWEMEYKGNLVAGNNNNPSDFICMDESPEVIIGGAANDDTGRLLYPVRSHCDPLPCPPYISGNFVSCVVCSK